MLIAAFAILSLTAAVGMLLATGRLRGGFGGAPGWMVGVAHGAFGAAGLAALLVALSRADLSGPFAWDVAGLLAAGLVVGVGMALHALRTGHLSQAAVVLHAALAGIGYLILAGFALG